MKNTLKKILGKKLTRKLLSLRDNFNIYRFKKAVFSQYAHMPASEISYEEQEVLDFLKTDGFNLFPYQFIKKYKPEDVATYVDEESGLRYAYWGEHKFYFKRSLTEKECKEIFSMLQLVQDPESPHAYITKEYEVSVDDVIVDAGAAEGDFTISIIDTVKKAYIFEADPELIEVLQLTFEPWKDKIVIVHKYVSDIDDARNITLDQYFKDYKNEDLPTFFKVDIEGAEMQMLRGAKNVLSSQRHMRILLATYHKHDDEIILKEELTKYGFAVGYSKRYMLSLWDGIIKKPYMRRALIRAKK